MTAAFLTAVTSTHLDAPRLLIVDDDPAHLTFSQAVFEQEYITRTAVDGDSALALLAVESFDLVLLDITMPLMNGFEVLQAIRARATAAELPVILVSGRSGDADIVRGLQMGANDYLSKPFAVEIALARVRAQMDLKRASDEQRRLIDSLETMRGVQEQFYRIVSHDLKGPLTNIRIAGSILREVLPENTQTDPILDNIEMTVEDMLEMIKLFLDASALQRGAISMDIQCVSVRDIASSVIRRTSLLAGKKNIQVTAEHAEGLILADVRLISQIMMNLVGNALKFSPSESAISIWTEIETDDVLICVADQGPGVPLQDRPFLFEMFRTLAARPTGGESSHGLGLWIVRQLVEQQGGSVSYVAPPDGGSVFVVRLPICVI